MSTASPRTSPSDNEPAALRLARGLAAVRFDDLSAAAVAKAKLCLLDYFASAFVSTELPWGRQAIALAAASEGFHPVVGTSIRSTAGDAAFANAVLGHALVRDDMHLGSVSHLGVVVIPPALSAAGENRCTGRELIAAVIAGYEAGGRLGRAILDVDVARIFRPTGLVGPVAGAVAAGRLLGLDRTGLANAIGIAANTALGYNEWAGTGGSEMFMQIGFAARNAVSAAQLAHVGTFASATAIDGAAGLLAAFGKQDNAGTLHSFDGDAEIMSVFFKEVPACNFAQAAAQAARAIALSRDIEPGSIRSVSVRVPHAAAAYPGCDAPGPLRHTLQAKMSIHYNVAAALLRGSFDEANYAPEANEDIGALAQRVSLAVDETLTKRFPARQGAIVQVDLADGETLTHTQDDVAPAEDTAVESRFDAAASERLGRERALALREAAEGLASIDDITTLIALTCGSEDEKS